MALTRTERIRLNALLTDAGWLSNARKGIATAFTPSDRIGECGMITYRFGDGTARAMLAGELAIPVPAEIELASRI